MKKYFLAIIIFILLIFPFKTDKISQTFDYSNMYNIYTIKVNNKKISEIKDIFDNTNSSSYVIVSYYIANNYNEHIRENIENISIKPGLFVESFSEYLKKYNEVLLKYNLDNEVGKSPIIETIIIKTTYSIYEEISYKLK